MKPNLTQQYPYAGDYYSYTIRTSADGTVTEKVYVGVPTQVQLDLRLNIIGQLQITSQTKMQRESLIKNIVDKNGEQIYEDGVWEIVRGAPLLSTIGTKEGYQYAANLISGDI
jgi:hypothetical protein